LACAAYFSAYREHIVQAMIDISNHQDNAATTPQQPVVVDLTDSQSQSQGESESG